MVKISIYGKRNFFQRLLHGGFTWNKGKWIIQQEHKRELNNILANAKEDREANAVDEFYFRKMRVIKPSNSFQIMGVV